MLALVPATIAVHSPRSANRGLERLLRQTGSGPASTDRAACRPD